MERFQQLKIDPTHTFLLYPKTGPMPKNVQKWLFIMYGHVIYCWKPMLTPIWKVVYQFWAHLIWVPKLGKPGESFVKVHIYFK